MIPTIGWLLISAIPYGLLWAVAPGIGGDILAPTGDRDASPVAITRARAGKHDGVAAVRQEMGLRYAAVRRDVAPLRRRHDGTDTRRGRIH